MARRRFFVDEVRSGYAELLGDEAQHLTRVLRVEPGQRYEISDNAQLYLAEVEEARKSRVLFRIIERLDAEPPPAAITLAAALIKFERFEYLVEKATELGAATIVPVHSDRSERGLLEAAGKRVARWRRIARESSQQARRPRLPVIAEPVRFSDFRAEARHRLFLDEDPGATPILQSLPAERRPTDTICLAAGPEGGWTDRERDAMGSADWTRVSLGPLILRAETAAIAGLAIVMAAWAAPVILE
jgi:16S rRNA (uracil1498-N3)-methyltransferase